MRKSAQEKWNGGKIAREQMSVEKLMGENEPDPANTSIGTTSCR